MKEFKLGEKITYRQGNKWLKGKVHAVRKVDGKRGPVVHSYLVDNGKTHLEDEILTEGNKPNIKVSQPIQVEVSVDDIKPAE